MQIQKIDNNKIEVFINMEDLNRNNISLNNFMSTFIEKQDLYFYILNLACKKSGFSLDNCKIKVDSFAILSKRIFVLIITRIPRLIYINKIFKNSTFFIVRFKNFNTLTSFCNSINSNINSTLYYYKKSYYLKIDILYMRDFKRIFFILKEFANDVFENSLRIKKIL